MSASEYYAHGSYPTTRASLSSSAMRSELELIEAGFAKLPDLSGNGSKLVAVNAGATALEAVTTGTGVLTFLGTPSSANLASAVTDETGTGALVFANTPTLVTPVLGTPTSGTLTNCTGLPVSTGISGLAAGVATFLGTPSSANLRSALTDETGSGAAVFGTAPTISAAVLTGTTDLSGGQIKFPAAQSASADANTLDDYEEGTFTPVLAFGGASVGITYTTQAAKYTKVGNEVSFQLVLQLTNKGSSTGTATITGLPFTINASSTLVAFAVAALTVQTTSGGILAYGAANGTSVSLAQQNTGVVSLLTDANFLNNTQITVSGTYFV